MKKLSSLLLVILLLPAFSGKTAAYGLEWRGDFTAGHRLLLQDGNECSHVEYRLDLQPEARLGRSSFTGQLWLSSPGLPAGKNNMGDSEDLTGHNAPSSWDLEMREAYVDLYDFPLNGMDFRAGRQRIAWGAGDLVSPTDNLNPQDLLDIKDFGRRLGSDAVQLAWYPGDITLTAVYIPVFTPARLPANWLELFSQPAATNELPVPLVWTEQTNIKLQLPSSTPGESSAVGLKLSGRLGGYDLSLSYVDGRYDLPLVKEARGKFINPLDPMEGIELNEALLFFPRRRVLGFDLAGELAGAGVWAEAAVFFPEKVTTVTTIESGPIPLLVETKLLDKPYLKYLAGADYTFPDGTYVNLQYLHGFPHERGREALEEYFLFALEKTLQHGRVKIVPLAGMLKIRDFQKIKENYALVLAPEISWYPVDGAEITLGINWIEAAGDSLFSSFRENDEVYLKIKYSF